MDVEKSIPGGVGVRCERAGLGELPAPLPPGGPVGMPYREASGGRARPGRVPWAGERGSASSLGKVKHGLSRKLTSATGEPNRKG